MSPTILGESVLYVFTGVSDRVNTVHVSLYLSHLHQSLILSPPQSFQCVHRVQEKGPTVFPE